MAVVQSVENHPNSEKLYVCKIDVGGGTIKQVPSLLLFCLCSMFMCTVSTYMDSSCLLRIHRLQVVAGLKKFVTVEELQGKLVCVILNLKTAKLAGQVSEAMILAGSVATPEGSEIVKVGSMAQL